MALPSHNLWHLGEKPQEKIKIKLFFVMSEKEEREEKEKSSPEEKLFEFLKQWPFMLSDFHSIVKQLQRRYDLFE